jgi:hypothetical protein
MEEKAAKDKTQEEKAAKGKAQWAAAADLTLWCLQSNPSRRPQSMDQVLMHPFLAQDSDPSRRPQSMDQVLMHPFLAQDSGLSHELPEIEPGTARDESGPELEFEPQPESDVPSAPRSPRRAVPGASSTCTEYSRTGSILYWWSCGKRRHPGVILVDM